MYNPTADDYAPGKPPWIRSKKRFRLAMMMTAILTVLNIRYPGLRPLYEEGLLAIRVPISIPLPGGGQLMYTGLLFLGLALWTLFLIWDSLNRHRILFGLALLWLLPMAGSAALAGVQMVIPASVYTVNVDQDQTNCTYVLGDGKMTGQCSVIVTNRGNREITVRQITGSGHASLSADGFKLEMNDGKRIRVWGE